MRFMTEKVETALRRSQSDRAKVASDRAKAAEAVRSVERAALDAVGAPAQPRGRLGPLRGTGRDVDTDADQSAVRTQSEERGVGERPARRRRRARTAAGGNGQAAAQSCRGRGAARRRGARRTAR